MVGGGDIAVACNGGKILLFRSGYLENWNCVSNPLSKFSLSPMHKNKNTN